MYFSQKIMLYWFLLIIFPISFYTHAEIYKWKDTSGKLHYSDKPSENAPSEKLNIQINSYTSATTERLSSKQYLNKNEKVVMYSTSWCGYCKKARRHFKKNNIPFVEYDIERNKKAKREYNNLKATGVPVILVGDQRMNGFSKSRFNKMYAKYKQNL